MKYLAIAIIFILVAVRMTKTQGYELDVEVGQQGVYISFMPEQVDMTGYKEILTTVEDEKGTIVLTERERVDQKDEDYEIMVHLPAGTYKATMYNNGKSLGSSKLFKLSTKK